METPQTIVTPRAQPIVTTRAWQPIVTPHAQTDRLDKLSRLVPIAFPNVENYIKGRNSIAALMFNIDEYITICYCGPDLLVL
jgi:hypothetical protein